MSMVVLSARMHCRLWWGVEPSLGRELPVSSAFYLWSRFLKNLLVWFFRSWRFGATVQIIINWKDFLLTPALRQLLGWLLRALPMVMLLRVLDWLLSRMLLWLKVLGIGLVAPQMSRFGSRCGSLALQCLVVFRWPARIVMGITAHHFVDIGLVVGMFIAHCRLTHSLRMSWRVGLVLLQLCLHVLLLLYHPLL